MTNLLIIDFEEIDHNITEFPVVVVDLETGLPTGQEFLSFCNPKTFPRVFESFLDWLKTNEFTAENTLVVTCGDGDIPYALIPQCERLDIPFPYHNISRWCNIKEIFAESAVSGSSSKTTGMKGMLHRLGLPLRGKHHSGIDDARNIASIVCELIKCKVEIRATAFLTE